MSQKLLIFLTVHSLGPSGLSLYRKWDLLSDFQTVWSLFIWRGVPALDSLHCCLLFWHEDNPRFTPIIASGKDDDDDASDRLTDILFPSSSSFFQNGKLKGHKIDSFYPGNGSSFLLLVDYRITSNSCIWIVEFWHFPPIFVLLKLTCLVTLFDRKLQVFKNSPILSILRLFLWFSNTVLDWSYIIIFGELFIPLWFVLHF